MRKSKDKKKLSSLFIQAIFRQNKKVSAWKRKYLSARTQHHTHNNFRSLCENWFDKYLIFTRKISKNQSAKKIMKKNKKILKILESNRAVILYFICSRSFPMIIIKNCFICGENENVFRYMIYKRLHEFMCFWLV